MPGALVSAGGESIPMGLAYYGETSRTCGLDADGAYMFDDALRPSTSLVAVDGVVRVLIERPGTMRHHDALTPDLRLAIADGPEVEAKGPLRWKLRSQTTAAWA